MDVKSPFLPEFAAFRLASASRGANANLPITGLSRRYTAISWGLSVLQFETDSDDMAHPLDPAPHCVSLGIEVFRSKLLLAWRDFGPCQSSTWRVSTTLRQLATT
jgi:hypothetical protein